MLEKYRNRDNKEFSQKYGLLTQISYFLIQHPPLHFNHISRQYTTAFPHNLLSNSNIHSMTTKKKSNSFQCKSEENTRWTFHWIRNEWNCKQQQHRSWQKSTRIMRDTQRNLIIMYRTLWNYQVTIWSSNPSIAECE